MIAVASLEKPWVASAVAICVPVRNESMLLPLLLDALSRQHCDVPMVLCILFDACTDDSERIVRSYGATLPFRVVTGKLAGGGPPDAGRARRAAMALADTTVRRYRRVALLTTDADSAPAPDWVAASVRALRMAEVAAGRIVRDRTSHQADQDRLENYYDRLFALRRSLDPVPWEAEATHHYAGGANLAFRAESYAALGGFAHRAAGEDAAIIDAAHRAGLRVRRDASMIVETSSRRIGRAVGGLADHLHALAGPTGPAAIRVSHPADAAWQYEGHALARQAFVRAPDTTLLHALARRIEAPIDHVVSVAQASPNAEAFALRLVPGSPHGERVIDLAEAELAIDQLTGFAQEQAA